MTTVFLIAASLFLAQSSPASPTEKESQTEAIDQIKAAGGQVIAGRPGIVLTVIFTNSKNVDDKIFKAISTLSQLRVLTVRNAGIDPPKFSAKALSYLVGLEKLSDLELSGCNITEAGVKHLSGLSGLNGLNISRTNIGDKALRSLVNIPDLARLNIQFTRVTDEGLAIFSRHPNLKRLSLSHGTITDDGLRQLKQYPSLESVSLFGDFSETGYEHLSEVTTLTNIVINSSQHVTVKSLASLAKLPSLDRLHSVSSSIGDEHLKSIGKLEHLDSLHLVSDKITDTGFQEIRSLKRLSHLYLQSSGITDEAIDSLLNLPEFEQILIGPTITDAGLEKLGRIETLKFISLLECDISQSALDQFRTAHPKVRVSHTKPREKRPR